MHRQNYQILMLALGTKAARCQEKDGVQSKYALGARRYAGTGPNGWSMGRTASNPGIAAMAVAGVCRKLIRRLASYKRSVDQWLTKLSSRPIRISSNRLRSGRNGSTKNSAIARRTRSTA